MRSSAVTAPGESTHIGFPWDGSPDGLSRADACILHYTCSTGISWTSCRWCSQEWNNVQWGANKRDGIWMEDVNGTVLMADKSTIMCKLKWYFGRVMWQDTEVCKLVIRSIKPWPCLNAVQKEFCAHHVDRTITFTCDDRSKGENGSASTQNSRFMIYLSPWT